MNDRHSIRHFPYFVASLSLQERANQKFLINLSVLLLCTSRRKVVKDFNILQFWVAIAHKQQ